MTCSSLNPTVKRPRAFSEANAWKSVGPGWCQLSGGFGDHGYSVEWHDFMVDRELDWSRSFHPGGLELCLNLTGRAEVRGDGRVLELSADTAGFYLQSRSQLKAFRRAGERHRFATIEFSKPFLRAHIPPRTEAGYPLFVSLFTREGGQGAAVSGSMRMNSDLQQVVGSLCHPPVCASARPMWYQAKALEIAATLLYRPSPTEELFCQRVKRLNGERAQKVRAILKENLAEPPSLEEIGRRVGCSHFHLSRIFTQETGKTITSCLRELRLERAAQLLRSGQCNVTEAAFEVGYNSLSHFTVSFRETFGCCPGLYPVRAPLETAVQRQAKFF